MKKILPVFLIPILFLLFSPLSVFAASLDVSKSPSFSSNDLNFSAGETVYVRVSADSGATNYVLNIRDSNYSIVKTVGLFKSGSTYSANFSAPEGVGYYSLEAKIEGEGSSSTSVKTIKVGSPSSANVKVNVNSSVKGTKSEGSEKSDNSDESENSNNSKLSENSDKFEKSDKSDKSEVKEEPDSLIEVYKEKPDENKGFSLFASVFKLVDGIVSFFKFN